ncbi:transcription initiation factor TFIID subunit 2 [Ziziphus jujuba]|uniref:Transcription initiation factor TFIID subunit 2 n=1 Tax=Ziziphus jujuba TaxID=326968 RepID=A0ABM3IIG5_ZIZJJ|nr:transcription initiation factor TFIID subunit 2 [Ziziphus jujuba]
MAKPRKPKNEDSKPDNSGAVVRHQKLCLSIEIDKRRIYGYTELEIVVPEIGIVGLHAENLGIENVLVDGEPTEFEYYPHNYPSEENESRWSYVTTPTTAADAAGSAYFSALEKELFPNLLINCCKAFKTGNEMQELPVSDNGVQQSSGEANQNVRLVRVDYWVEKAESGIHFDSNVLHTDNQIRRARCWFPCIDDTLQRCCYDLEFTVAQNLTAVSTGSLLYQVLSKDDPPRKTYVYRLDVPVSARWISLAVGPFEILPDHQFSVISHMCLPSHFSKLRNTVDFFHSAYSFYKDYLSVNFPFGSYKQVFVEPEMAVSSLCLGASMSIFSSQILFDEKIIDQTIDTRIKLAYALARQWFGAYITPEAPNDEWLLEGLAGFMTDLFIKKYLGNNEARYRRYKANCAVCKADNSGATSLSSSASCRELYGTQCIGLYSKIRSWKSVAVLQMLEKQMGPESFRKILQTIVSRAQDKTRSLRSLSTKEFRHLANKVGNLERPFLKEFFPRWVELCGCPALRMGFSYNKRKNMVELAVLRGCTAMPDSSAPVINCKPESENRDSDIGWPGMMSIRVYELDGTFDHPVLPMAGETCQLVEIQCHSKLAARRFQKPKKGLKPDGSDDNGDVPVIDMRSSMESPLLWMRADPEMEYLAEIHFNQPVQMWINQLEKDKDVVAQAQAIAMLEALPQLSFSAVNALNNFLIDSKAFWRVRIEAAFALANTASEETDWAGLLHLVKFYKSRRFDANIGLPKPNDFHDFSEYFVLEAIPHAIAMVRAGDKKSPREAVEFVLQLLKYNDNNGNPYSDVFWLAALIQSVGELEFGQQSILFLSSLLKRIDRLLQFDRLMPSYNGILTISCIRTLAQIALKLSGFFPLERVFELIKPFRDIKALWQVRIEASRALLDLEFQCRGIDAALSLFMKYLEEEPSLRGQVKLSVHAMRLCQLRDGSNPNDDIKSQTLVSLLCLLEGRKAFNNIFLRHYLFCILQVLAGRPLTLYGVPRDQRPLHLSEVEACNEQKNIFTSYVSEIKPISDVPSLSHDGSAVPEPLKDTLTATEAYIDGFAVPDATKDSLIVQPSTDGLAVPEVAKDDLPIPEASKDDLPIPEAIPEALKDGLPIPEASKDGLPIAESSKDGFPVPEPSKEADTISTSHERKKPIVKIRVRRSSTTSRAEEADNQTVERSQGGYCETDRGATSSVSVDAPHRNFAEAVSISNQNLEEVNSCHDRGSRMTASIGSAKLASDGDELGKELLCTADSSIVAAQPQLDDPSSSSFIQDNNVDIDAQKYASLQTLSDSRHDLNGRSVENVNSHHGKEKKDKKKDKEKKRKRESQKGHRDDPEYLERKRLKKEKKRKEKEISKLLNEEANTSRLEFPSKKEELGIKSAATSQPKPIEPITPKLTLPVVDSKPRAPENTSSAPKFRFKIKNRTLNKS